MNMKKSLIALAVASVFVAPTAMAEATVYGQVNMAYELTDNGGDTTPATVGADDVSRTQVSSNSSRIGVKGSEDLGDGLSAVFQMEGTVGMDTGASMLFDRNTYLGLSSTDFGTVKLGNIDTPYKSSTRGLDMFADSIADNRSLMGMAGALDSRESDALVAYTTPNFGGFTGALTIIGETDNTLAGSAPPSTSSGTSLSANYGKDNWSATFGYVAVNVADTTTSQDDDTTGTKLGGSYAMDAFAINAVYEMISAEAAGVKTDSTNLYLAGKYNLSDKSAVKLAYTMAGESDSGGVANKDKATQISLGYDHAMTKNTTLFALYTSVSNDIGADYGLESSASTGDVAAGALTAGGAGDPSAIAFGVRHSF